MGYQLVVEDVPDRTIPDETFLNARLSEISLREFSFNDRKTGEAKTGRVFEWWFEVSEEGKYKERKVKGQTDAIISNHPRNKLRAWAETLLGRDLGVGQPLNTDELVGLPVKIYVKHEADRKDPSKTYERVDDLIPVTGGALPGEPPF